MPEKIILINLSERSLLLKPEREMFSSLHGETAALPGEICPFPVWRGYGLREQAGRPGAAGLTGAIVLSSLISPYSWNIF
jgi:hypothetical protein